jgi:hypothetical protein
LIGLEKRINNMFTPIGFFAPQAGGGDGFDVTLGGTLTVAYHWDFTDSSTMTLSGTDLDDITDKVGSITLQLLTPQTNITATKATFASGKTTFAGLSAYYNTANWVPDEMKNNGDWTVVQFSRNDFSALPLSRIIAPWGLAGTRGDSQGHNNVRQTQFSPSYDPYGMSTCLSGTYYFAAQRFDSGWTGTKQAFTGTPAQADKNMVTFVYDYTNTDISVTVNDNTLCTANDSFGTPQYGGNGFQIGGRDSDGNGNWHGDMYHTIVYPFAMSQTNVDDLYASWDAFNA